MCWVYMVIAQIAQEPPPLCQMDKRGKKSVPNHPGKPLHPRANLCKQNAPNHHCKPLHIPKGVYSLGREAPFQNVLVLQGVFFKWASPEFAKCWPVSNRFQKNVRVPDWPPLMIEKKV